MAASAIMPKAAMDVSRFLAEIGDRLGERGVITATADIDGYCTDWLGKYRAKALAVLRPASTTEVADVVRLCLKHGVTITPQGGNTGLVGGSVPASDDRPAVILSLQRLQAIRNINPAARSATAEAGVVLETLQSAADEAGFVFPLTFGAKGSCTIGGNLATNAGGSNVVRYGNARDLCLGLEAVLPDGSIIDSLSGLRKNNTGYDLRNLLIGSEGTLGIITAATVKLFPRPKSRATAFVAVAGLEAALDLLNRLQDATGGLVEAFEYMPGGMVDLICRHVSGVRSPLATAAETGVLVEIASSRPADAEAGPDGTIALRSLLESVLGGMMEEGLLSDAVISGSERERNELWRMRESVLEAITANGPARILDIALPLDRVSDFVVEMNARSEEAGLTPLIVAHLGDGNLHYCLSPADGRDWATLPVDVVEEAALALVTAMAGSFSAEHGIGRSKREEMARRKPASDLAAMRAIKAALDPHNILNPGKML